MDPTIIAALIGAGTNLLGNQMRGDQAEEQAPLDLLKSLNPAQNLQSLQSGFAIPGMQNAGMQLLGGR